MKPNQIRLAILLTIVVLVAMNRVWWSMDEAMIPWLNFSPIGAMALFSGTYFRGIKAVIFPLLALWIGDIFINYGYYGEWRFFYEGFYWTYGAFALMVLVGYVVMKNRSVSNFLLATLIIVLLHWIITDFGVWLEGTMYPKTWSGFWACLVAAIPFERNFLFGTLLYGFMMFGAFEWFSWQFPALRLAKQVA